MIPADAQSLPRGLPVIFSHQLWPQCCLKEEDGRRGSRARLPGPQGVAPCGGRAEKWGSPGMRVPRGKQGLSGSSRGHVMSLPQVNGKELSKLSQEQTLEALRASKEPLVIQVLRRSPRLRGDGSSHDLQLVDSGTQTDITFEHIMALGKLRPPTPPMVILEPPPISHEYYDPAEFMEGGPQEADRMDELEYEEVELYKTSHRDKLGLMVCYRTDDEEDLGIYVGEVNPNSIAAKDGRIREGDRIIQINGVDVQNREEAVAILSQEENTNISLLVARPESQLAKRWKDSDRDDFLDDCGSENEGDLRARKLKSPPAQQLQLGNEEEKGAPDAGPGLSNSQELDSGVGRTDESTRNEESSEHDLLGDEPLSTANTPGPLRKFGLQGDALQSRDFHFSMDSLLAEGAGLGGGDVPGLTDEEYERYRELLEIKCHLENGNPLGLLFPRAAGGNGALDVNRNESVGHEMAVLEEELRHLEFKCRNILRAQKMQQLRERCMKAWLLEEESLYDLGAGEPKKHELSDISELPEKSDKDSTSAYNTGESCRSTPLLAEPLPESPLRRATAGGNSNLNRTPSGHPVAAHPKAAPPQGSPAKLRSLSRDPEVGRRQRSEERVRRSPKTGVTLERVGPEGSPYLSRRHRGQGQEGERYHSCVQLAPPRGLEELGHGALSLASGPRVGGAAAAAATEAPRMEWKVKVRSDGTRYVAKRPVRDRLLKARALKIREERSGMTTDDDAVSEMKMGRYWSKEERKQHLLRAREQRRRREFMLQSRLECLREQSGDSRAELNIIALSHRKTMKKRSKKILDNWITIQEMLAHGTRSADGKRVYNPLLSVTTV
ncbi:PDZ domain-containing protein 4 isoform X2 [Balaenoptera musculus]|uniref:PDZ domain-containing protein 4 isoform X2 n=1 Tax=Balaenoptera musculus TaxID=9771 RepID=A0A8B8WHW6_BALMU|nr:PDZ domain-containing protein 4 isoform X2 [Balaenoptera musculus]